MFYICTVSGAFEDKSILIAVHSFQYGTHQHTLVRNMAILPASLPPVSYQRRNIKCLSKLPADHCHSTYFLSSTLASYANNSSLAILLGTPIIAHGTSHDPLISRYRSFWPHGRNVELHKSEFKQKGRDLIPGPNAEHERSFRTSFKRERSQGTVRTQIVVACILQTLSATRIFLFETGTQRVDVLRMHPAFSNVYS
jgi:hypothetical protein